MDYPKDFLDALNQGWTPSCEVKRWYSEASKKTITEMKMYRPNSTILSDGHECTFELPTWLVATIATERYVAVCEKQKEIQKALGISGETR